MFAIRPVQLRAALRSVRHASTAAAEAVRAATQLRTPIIQPIFVAETGPALDEAAYTIDCAGLGRGEIEARMRETFDAVGLIKLENTGAKDAEEMRDLAEIILSDGMEA